MGRRLVGVTQVRIARISVGIAAARLGTGLKQETEGGQGSESQKQVVVPHCAVLTIGARWRVRKRGAERVDHLARSFVIRQETCFERHVSAFDALEAAAAFDGSAGAKRGSGSLEPLLK